MSREEQLVHFYGLAKRQNDTLKQENRDLLLKIKRQSEQLALVQNCGKVKNEELNRLKEELKSLRQQNGCLTREKQNFENNHYLAMGQIAKLEEEKGKIIDNYKKEVKYLEDSLKKSNEHVKYLHGELQKRVEQSSLTQTINDLRDKLKDNQECIRNLKEKKNDDETKMNKMIQKEEQFKVSLESLTSKLSAVEEEKARILQELMSLKEENNDRTCLICNKKMQESEWETLPKCTTCKIRYHEHCISKWFVEKIECPHCRADGMNMENISRLNILSSGLENVHL